MTEKEAKEQMSLELLESLVMPDASEVWEREKARIIERSELSAAKVLNEFCRKNFESWGFTTTTAECTYTDSFVTIVCIPIHSIETASTMFSRILLKSDPTFQLIVVAKELKILRFCRESLGQASEKAYFALTDELFNAVRKIVGGSDTYYSLSKVKGYNVRTEFNAEVAVMVHELLGEKMSQKDILTILRLIRIKYQVCSKADY